MKNADKFKDIFGLYASELWSFSEKKFLEWLNEDVPDINVVKWIPCKERLPEVGRNVLLSVGKGLYTAEGELKYDGTWVQYRWSANIENVDAWAEMPEPWKGEEDDT